MRVFEGLKKKIGHWAAERMALAMVNDSDGARALKILGNDFLMAHDWYSSEILQAAAWHSLNSLTFQTACSDLYADPKSDGRALNGLRFFGDSLNCWRIVATDQATLTVAPLSKAAKARQAEEFDRRALDFADMLSGPYDACLRRCYGSKSSAINHSATGELLKAFGEIGRLSRKLSDPQKEKLALCITNLLRRAPPQAQAEIALQAESLRFDGPMRAALELAIIAPQNFDADREPIRRASRPAAL